MITVGEMAPEFTLEGSNGEEVRLADFRGKNVVLYFYPKDMTPGCTTEACDFRDAYEVFQEKDTVILGVSPDSANRHLKFIEKHELPFTLLVDEDHKVAELYDVWKLKKNFGKEYMGIERSTFLINKDGELVKEWRKVKVKGHIEDVLSYIK
ncbi:thioredoxin-dependent thiol peroxidase [Bacillus cereus]|uniref:thioredoxin-dependent thiol peroxidase n=1 Tax=Bacillus cereus TaxID=1396 RepID=UPI000BFE8F52|nr:thioredoxin-dependent thiol peroxidase [Bacillus cereus]PGM72252.1 thioredoxin-dependent thiol peroxidase [Bacillus cereus]PGN04085.1 thioredoxin-dependent thiol peroxidase [Bacillus cereus]